MPDPPRDVLEAERRLAAVAAVDGVVRAAWAMARAQQPAVEAAAVEAGTWLDQVEQVVDRLAGPPLAAPAAETLWVLVGPERPLCGPLARALLDQLPVEGEVGLVGTRLAEVADTDRALRGRLAFCLAAAATPDELGVRAEAIAGAVLAAAGSRGVCLLHPAASRPVLRKSVLLSGPRAPVPHHVETWSPPPVVLARAVAEVVAGRLAVGLAEALRAELRARLAATDAARRACEAELGQLRQGLQVLRQEGITRELLELSAAARPGRGR